MKLHLYLNLKHGIFKKTFQNLYSEYNTSIPGNYDYNIKLVGVANR